MLTSFPTKRNPVFRLGDMPGSDVRHYCLARAGKNTWHEEETWTVKGWKAKRARNTKDGEGEITLYNSTFI